MKKNILQNLEIVIMTRDRPEKLSRMIDSILHFKNEIGNLWISNNSTTKDTEELLKNKYPLIKSVHRTDISAWEHYQIIANEIYLPFSMILHDDDYVLNSISSVINSPLSQA